MISKEASKVPSHYFSGERKWSVVHARIRNLNGCSNLNYDLQQNHLSFISTCICGYSLETPLHYLLECKIFDKERADMFRDLSFSSLPSDLHSLLYGSTDLFTYTLGPSQLSLLIHLFSTILFSINVRHHLRSYVSCISYFFRNYY